VFEGNIIDQLFAVVEAAESRLRWEAAKAELSVEVPAQVSCEPDAETLLAGVA
jgi:hypothetical protein